MNGMPNPKVMGAFVIGLALVFGSFVLSNFGAPSTLKPQPATEQTPPRVAIAVKDTNNNGIEDWKETLVASDPIVIEENTNTDYVPPETLTGQFGIQFYKDFVRARGFGEFGASDEEVVGNSVATALREAEDQFYTEADLIIIPDSVSAYELYGNTIGQIISDNNVPNVGEPSTVLQQALNAQDETQLEDIEKLRTMYLALRDQYLNTPVPEYFVPAHLILINAFNALYNDMEGFLVAFDDPLYALLRVKRYQDDVVGLKNGMEIMAVALDQSSDEFIIELDDPAVIFFAFIPDGYVR
ncbi:MAG: hypothetical protein AAGA35_02705 [Patescibacteria group bacterium]